MKTYKHFKKFFNQWDNDRTPLYFKNKLTYQPQETEIFKQCYLPEKDSSEPFYKFRHGLPKNWFISQIGTIITVNSDHLSLLIGQINSSDRLQVALTDATGRYLVARESLVAIIFPELNRFSENARKIIEKKGIRAFNRTQNISDCCQCHHVHGYRHPEEPMNITQIFDNLSYNTAQTKILTWSEHMTIHRV